MSDTIIIRRNGEKFAVDCSTVLEAFNGHLKVKFDGIICPKCGASDSCWIPVRKVEEGGEVAKLKRTLEQLGISPAPWTKAGDIVDDNEGHVIFNAYEDDDYANAHLIAAAPKLYAACYEMLRYYYEQNKNTTVFNTALELMKQAVAEAAGESEVKDNA